MKKKIGIMTASIAMAGAMAVSIGLTGCSKTKIYDFNMPEGGFDTETPVEIMFYNTMGQNFVTIFEDAISRFQTLYPNITVNYDRSSGDYDTLRDKIATEIQAGVQPNLAFCYPDHVALYNQSGVVLPLDDFLPDGAFGDMTVKNTEGTESLGLSKNQVNDYISTYFNEGKQFEDGKLYTLPFAKSTEVLYYNKSFFEEHSDVLTEPTDKMTWEDIFETCRKIKEIDKDCVPLGIDSESNLFITLCEQYESKYTSASGKHYLFNNATNKAFVQKFKDWYGENLFTTETINKSYTSNLFKEKKSYLSIGSSAGAQYQAPDTTDGAGAFEVGIVTIPQVNPDKPKSISQGPSLCIFKQQNPQEVLASWLFAKFITTDLEFQALYSMQSGYVPVINSAFENAAYKAHLAKASGYKSGITAFAANVCKELVEKKAYYVSPAFLGSSKARDEVGTLMVAAITGAKTIDKAFADAIEECEYFAG